MRSSVSSYVLARLCGLRFLGIGLCLVVPWLALGLGLERSARAQAAASSAASASPGGSGRPSQ
ncbi:MAG TPA: hypothetical protein VGC79_26455, partial [Polyangiaceae bacterium]